MYERFTDRARIVMNAANSEAQRFSHEYVGTEHILLGLVKEGEGVAAHVLKCLGADLRKIRIELENIVQPGPELVTMGKVPMTPRAKKVIEYAMEESHNLQHGAVDTEHLLIGLLREKEGVAAQLLNYMGVTIDAAREEVLNTLGLDSRPIEMITPTIVSTGTADSTTLSEPAKSAINTIHNLPPNERRLAINEIVNHQLKSDSSDSLNDMGFEVQNPFWISLCDLLTRFIPYRRRRR